MTSGGPNSTGSPPKPWEKALEEGLHSSSGEMGASPHPGQSGGPLKGLGFPPQGSQSTTGATMRQPQVIRNPPTMPPVAARSTVPSVVNPSSYYNNLTQRGTFGRSGYGANYGGGYGAYRQPYSSFGGGYGGYGANRSYNSYLGNGQPQTGQGEFATRAQRGIEPGFRSIENIVRACASISNLMESTLGSVHMSFTALIDVVEHFAHVKLTLTDNRFWRFIALLWRKFVNFLLRRRSMEEAWDQTSPLVTGGAAAVGRSRSWPLLIFLSIVFGGPFFMWTVFRGTPTEPTPDSGSAVGNVVGAPLYVPQTLQNQPPVFQRQREVVQNYNATGTVDLSVLAGQIVFVQGKSEDGFWYNVKVLNTGAEGWIPGNFTRPYQARS